ncbi:hypothetical protein HJD18_14510 [Thermoleophilia bacterium SCSIO 60948]|nr:hypothetical protein HJD18_14510 [Thermoleophilia bacterium SCSIO 60948]
MASEQEIPEGSVAAGHRVKLPRGASEPIEVFINGVAQRRGEDFDVAGGYIVFPRQIIKEGKLGGIRWLSMLIGIAGTYRKHETVDVSYRVGERTRLDSDVAIIPDDPA